MMPAPAPRRVEAPPRPAPVQPTAPEGLLARFLGKKVVVRLVFGDTVTGTVHAVGRYEMAVLLTDGTTTVVFKNAVATISAVAA